jgi:hypothetical protein
MSHVERGAENCQKLPLKTTLCDETEKRTKRNILSFLYKEVLIFMLFLWLANFDTVTINLKLMYS